MIGSYEKKVYSAEKRKVNLLMFCQEISGRIISAE